jgi:hypothetical protein
MEIGPRVDSVRSLFLLSGEHLDVGLRSMPVRKQPALRGTPTDAPHVPKLLATRNATLTTSTPLWTQFSDSKDGTLMWNASSLNEKATDCFAKPAMPKSRKNKGK